MMRCTLKSNSRPESSLQHRGPAAPQVVACLQLEERASAAGLWPGDEVALLAAACVGQLHDLFMVVNYAKGGLLYVLDMAVQYVQCVMHAGVGCHMTVAPSCILRAMVSHDTYIDL